MTIDNVGKCPEKYCFSKNDTILKEEVHFDALAERYRLNGGFCNVELFLALFQMLSIKERFLCRNVRVTSVLLLVLIKMK